MMPHRNERADPSRRRLSFWALVAVVLGGAGYLYLRPSEEPWESVPLKPGEIQVQPLQNGPTIRVERLRFYSRRLGRARFAVALVPQGTQVQDVLLLNHGYWDRPEDLLTKLRVDRVYSSRVSEGRARPALVLLPDARFPWFFLRGRSDRPEYVDLFAVEIPQVVRQLYNVSSGRERWGIGGFSFGGYMALDVVRRFGDRFGSVSAISSFYEDNWMFWGERPQDADAAAHGTSGPVPRVFLACGTGDRYFKTATALHERLSSLGIPHEWSSGPGGHNWRYWSSVLDGVLDFHLGPKAFARSTAPVQ